MDVETSVNVPTHTPVDMQPDMVRTFFSRFPIGEDVPSNRVMVIGNQKPHRGTLGKAGLSYCVPPHDSDSQAHLLKVLSRYTHVVWLAYTVTSEQQAFIIDLLHNNESNRTVYLFCTLHHLMRSTVLLNRILTHGSFEVIGLCGSGRKSSLSHGNNMAFVKLVPKPNVRPIITSLV